MRHRDIKVGMHVCHQLPGGGDGKYLGAVCRINGASIIIDAVDGSQMLATPREIKPVKSS
jgi:hypothetical protein